MNNCDGRCVWAHEIGVNVGGVVYPYPGCPEHDPLPWDENHEDPEKFEPLPPEERPLPGSYQSGRGHLHAPNHLRCKSRSPHPFDDRCDLYEGHSGLHTRKVNGGDGRFHWSDPK